MFAHLNVNVVWHPWKDLKPTVPWLRITGLDATQELSEWFVLIANYGNIEHWAKVRMVNKTEETEMGMTPIQVDTLRGT